jgi:hypothetical protein
VEQIALLIGWILIGIPLALGIIGAILLGCFGRGQPGKEGKKMTIEIRE